MVIEAFYARSETDVITFSRDRKLRFSASLVVKFGLGEFQYARIGTDPELRRVYFAFQSEPSPGLPKFYGAQNSRVKIIAAGGLASRYDWIDAVFKEKEQTKRQFFLEEVDPQDEEIFPKYKYFVTIGYSWSNNRDFHDIMHHPVEPGVYRLKKNGEVVRIGESNNIARRFKEHLKDYADEVDFFDFEIVPSDEERKQEQNRMLQSFKAAVGRLPKLNPIVN